MNQQEIQERLQIESWMDNYMALSFGTNPFLSEDALWRNGHTYLRTDVPYRAPEELVEQVLQQHREVVNMHQDSKANRAYRLARFAVTRTVSVAPWAHDAPTHDPNYEARKVKKPAKGKGYPHENGTRKKLAALPDPVRIRHVHTRSELDFGEEEVPGAYT